RPWRLRPRWRFPRVFGSSLSARNALRRIQWLRPRRQCPWLFLPRAVELWRRLPRRWFSWWRRGTASLMPARLVERNKSLRMERNTMLHRISIFVQLEYKRFVRFTVSVLFALSLACLSAPMFAQEPGQQTFASAEDASRALFDAMHLQDEQAPLSILGPAGKAVLSTGDPTEDSDARAGFIVKYHEMHRFVTEPDGTVTLIVGAENWPFPIPLVNHHGTWYFDTDAGKDEIVFRRIGKNELS